MVYSHQYLLHVLDQEFLYNALLRANDCSGIQVDVWSSNRVQDIQGGPKTGGPFPG